MPRSCSKRAVSGSETVLVSLLIDSSSAIESREGGLCGEPILGGNSGMRPKGAF